MSSSSAVVPEGRLPGDRGVQAFADVPQRCALARRRPSSTAGTASGSASQQRGAGGDPVAASASASASWYSTSSAACRSTCERRQRRRRLRIAAAPTRSDVASISSIVASPAATSSGSASVACGGRGRPAARSPRAGCSATVRKVASATKARVPSLPTTRCARMSTGPSWSRKALSAVAHRVLDRELLADAVRTDVGVGADPVAQLAQSPRVQRRLCSRAAARRRRGRRCRGPCRSAARGRRIRACDTCSELGAARHAAGVVGDDAADGAGDLARRIRAELAAVPGQSGVDLTHGRARAGPDPRARRRAPRSPRKCRRVSTSTWSVPAWPDRLVPPERKVSGAPAAAACPEQRGHLVRRPAGSPRPAASAGSARRRGPAASRSKARTETPCAGRPLQ